MNNSHHSQESNFWFAFALGGSLVATVTFLLGTQKGREMLKKIISQAENISNESLIQEIIKGIEKLASSYQKDKSKQVSSPISVGSLLKRIESFAFRGERQSK